MSEPVLVARGLEAEGSSGPIFGPLDLQLASGQVCLVRGEKGSGKSALLLALSARFRPARGELIINGIDAIAEPRQAMKWTGVAQIGNYVMPEDRLTLAESIAERCYLDGVPLREGEDRVAQLEKLAGFTIDKSVELEDLTALERAAASVALTMLRPTKVVVIDDADLMVPHAQQQFMFDLFETLAQLDGAAIIASTVDDDTAPPTAVIVELARHRPDAARPIDQRVRVTLPTAKHADLAGSTAPLFDDPLDSDDSVVEPSAEDSVVEPSAEDSVVEPSAEDSVVEPLSGDSVVEPSWPVGHEDESKPPVTLAPSSATEAGEAASEDSDDPVVEPSWQVGHEDESKPPLTPPPTRSNSMHSLLSESDDLSSHDRLANSTSESAENDESEER